MDLVGKVMSLLLNMLSRLVITFLPRSKRLLISWLQLPSAVILEPPKIKSTEKAMAPHSSTLAWKIPWMEDPGGLQSLGSLRVGDDWSDLAAAAAWWSMGFPGGTSGKEPACQCRRCKKHGFHPWDSPGKNTGVGCHFLLQCVKVKSESEVTPSSPTLRPHGLQPTRIPRPWDSPGKSTGVGCHCLLRT